MTSRYMGCLKRKDFEELGVDYFHGDADVVASTKKLRLELDEFIMLMQNPDPGLPGILEGAQGFGMPCDEMAVEVPQLLQPPEMPVVDPEPPAVVSNDEKALVLYKPVNPPMFPGGSAAGSPDRPIKFNANCLANKAWQFHGMGNMADLFRVSRASHSMLNPGMPKIADIKDVDNSLAMIPWVPSQFPRPTQEVPPEQKLGCDNGIENNDLMPMEDEDMASMEEDPVQQTSPANVIGADGVQWQHCMTAPQPPQSTQVMWSY